MGFKELVIHSGTLHNTIGPALRRGLKKYVINFTFLVEEPKIPTQPKKNVTSIFLPSMKMDPTKCPQTVKLSHLSSI